MFGAKTHKIPRILAKYEPCIYMKQKDSILCKVKIYFILIFFHKYDIIKENICLIAQKQYNASMLLI